MADIPANWLDGTSCALWPDNIKAPGRINNAVIEKVPPGESWPAYPIRELYRNGEILQFYILRIYYYHFKAIYMYCNLDTGFLCRSYVYLAISYKSVEPLRLG